MDHIQPVSAWVAFKEAYDTSFESRSMDPLVEMLVSRFMASKEQRFVASLIAGLLLCGIFAYMGGITAPLLAASQVFSIGLFLVSKNHKRLVAQSILVLIVLFDCAVLLKALLN